MNKTKNILNKKAFLNLKSYTINLINKNPKLIILIFGVLIFGFSILNGFVWDDEEQVVNNIYIRSLSNVPEFFTQSTFNTGGAAQLSGMYYKPIMTVFFSIVYLFSGVNAWGYHIVQLGFHILNAVLVYLIFKHFFKQKIGLFLSLIFLVHPGNSETVLYVSALQDVLYMFFGLLTFYLVIRKKELEMFDWVFVGALLLLSLLGKETGILFIPIIFVYFLFFNKQALVGYLKTSLLVIATYFIMRLGIAQIAISHNKLASIMRADLLTRLQTIPLVITFYLFLFILPFRLAVSQHWLTTKPTWDSFYLPIVIILTFVCLVILFGYTLYQKQTKFFKPYLLFSFIFFIALGLHSQIIVLDMTVAERWFYLMLFGLLGMVGVVLCESKKFFYKQQKTLIVIGLVILLIFAGKSFSRTLEWRDGLTLFTKDQAIAAGNYDFENNLGVYLYRAGKINQAQKHYLKSVRIAPHWTTNWNNLAVTYEIEGKQKKAAQAYLKAINNGDYYLAYENYAGLLIKQKKYQQAKQFLEKQAIPRFPYNQKLREMYIYILEVKSQKSKT